MSSYQMKPNICKVNKKFHNSEKQRQVVQNWPGHTAYCICRQAKGKTKTREKKTFILCLYVYHHHISKTILKVDSGVGGLW